MVELKQWSSASLVEDSIDLCVVPAYGGARLHPGEQVRRYCGHLGDFLATLVGRHHGTRPGLARRPLGRAAGQELRHAGQRASLPEFDRAARNTYKVLLTRGMLGSLMFSTDPETQRFLSRLLQGEVTSVARREASTITR